MTRKTAILAFLLIFVYSTGAQSPGKTISSSKVEDVAWLTGCWQMYDPAKNLRITEQWMAPDGGAMLGMSRTVQNGKMVGYEFLRLVRDEISVIYVSRPSQNSTDTTFRIMKWSSNEVTFAKPAHDFPQRIIYKLDGDKLNARIEGTVNGNLRGVDFPYVRVKCE